MVPVKSAKDLLRAHTQAVRRAEAPQLGRGLTGGGAVCIDLSPAQRATVAASHARALAILAAKNKTIAAADPNSGHRSRAKNRTPETQDKIRKRVASALDDEEGEGDGENDRNEGNKRRRVEEPPKTVTVFGKEMSREELDRLKSKKSANSHLVAEAELAAADKYFEVMERKDDMEEKMLGTFEVKTKAVTCHICNYTSFKVTVSAVSNI